MFFVNVVKKEKGKQDNNSKTFMVRFICFSTNTGGQIDKWIDRYKYITSYITLRYLKLKSHPNTKNRII